VSRPLKTAALFLPTGWAMRTLHGLISFGKGLGDLQPNLLMLGGFALVFAFLATRSLRVD
jgi:ABC-type multidrug transport system permease subunit